jgi:hypothetical protein
MRKESQTGRDRHGDEDRDIWTQRERERERSLLPKLQAASFT